MRVFTKLLSCKEGMIVITQGTENSITEVSNFLQDPFACIVELLWVGRELLLPGFWGWLWYWELFFLPIKLVLLLSRM